MLPSTMSSPAVLSIPEEVVTLLETRLPPRPSSQTVSLPFVTLTYAASLDSRLSLTPGEQTPLSGPQSKAMTHYLRSRHDAILVGVSTAVADNPGLNCRIEGVSLDQQPRPIILDPQLRWILNKDTRVLQAARAGKGHAPWVVVSTRAIKRRMGVPEHEQAVACLEDAGGELIALDYLADNGKWDWRFLLEQFAIRGVRSLMVEGGGGVINSLLGAENVELVDSIVVTLAPVYLGYEGVNVSPVRRKPSPAVRLTDVQWIILGQDAVVAARPNA